MNVREIDRADPLIPSFQGCQHFIRCTKRLFLCICVFVLGAYLKQQRSFEGDLVVVSGESWQCRGNGVGWRTSSSSLIEGKGMECLISPTLLREHVPPLQDTHACRYVHVYVHKNTYTHTIRWKMCKFVKTEIRLFSHKPISLSKTSREINYASSA